ncbi:Hypothetical protein SMAX5B_017708 [Scophthalmus maximus]|uniref:Uncharacterized protein n=1 Tax=Scophthalmus maximus TaxID=52904 RepID=A0A2U9BXN5_SCOMX|nr:Hypothetical protein SMAX5B_017708 [Scophthalmus maximus]
MQVTKQLGPATFRLSDGSRWHANRLRKVVLPSIAEPGADEGFDSMVGDLDLPAEQVQPPAGRPPAELLAVPETRRARVWVRPGYLEDYVTVF